MKRILSGIQPSGVLHIGNYFGMMEKMINHQASADLFCFIANYHAMTTVQDGPTLSKNTFDTAATFLALGIDPEKSTFWVQSDVPEVQDLTWALSTITPMGLLERCHSYKDKTAKGIAANHALFAYPVLMAADILIFQSNVVPVGRDQKQHLEVARDLAIKFNFQFGDTFTVPEPEIDDNVAVIPGVDGQKMSKSYGNTIDIFTTKEALRQTIMTIKTDAARVEDPKDPDKCNLYAIYKLFVDENGRQEMRARYKNGGLKYSDVKKELTELIWNKFEPNRARYEELSRNPDEIRRILKMGAEKARAVAKKTIGEVRGRMGLEY